ncbi:MAG: methyltransferase domain-containing protein [Planctomycetota bacterium]
MNDPLHQRIRQQYASDQGRRFYKTVMGDGGFDIHYGLYDSDSTSMQQATRATSERMLQLSLDHVSLPQITQILDLGSGRGGPAHFLANASRATVMCVDLCEEHHAENLQRARETGLEDRIETRVGSFDALPESWSSRFDLVWAQESFCHAADAAALLERIRYLLRQGGAITFSDIMISDDATDADANVFAQVNAIMRLTKPSDYQRLLTSNGFESIHFEDWTQHLETNFVRMLEQIETYRIKLQASGVASSYLDDFAESLRSRIAWAQDHVLRWGAFAAVRSR